MPAFVPRRIAQLLPGVRELVAHLEEAPAVAGQMPSGRGEGRSAQRLAALALRVAEADHEVGQRIHIEVIVLGRQLDPPAADGTPMYSNGRYRWSLKSSWNMPESSRPPEVAIAS